MLPKTRRFAVWVQVKHTAGMGFAGTGVGWTSPTHAIPVCHPNAHWPCSRTNTAHYKANSMVSSLHPYGYLKTAHKSTLLKEDQTMAHVHIGTEGMLFDNVPLS